MSEENASPQELADSEGVTDAVRERGWLLRRIADLENAVRNQRGDELCWIQNPENAEVAKVLPESEFLESCRRFHAQLASERGVFTRGRTIAQLEAEIEERHAKYREMAQEATTTELELMAQIDTLQHVCEAQRVTIELLKAKLK